MLFWIITLIGAIIGLFFGVSDSTRRDRLLHDSFLGILWGGLAGIGVALILCFFIGIGAGDERFQVHNEPPAKLLNLEDQRETKLNANGAFVLVAGGFSLHEETDTSYTFYQETHDGSYFQHEIHSDADTGIRIHFIPDGVTPYVVQTIINSHEESPSWLVPFGWDFSPDYDEEDSEQWTIYIPRGTLVTQFKLDGK